MKKMVKNPIFPEKVKAFFQIMGYNMKHCREILIRIFS